MGVHGRRPPLKVPTSGADIGPVKVPKRLLEAASEAGLTTRAAAVYQTPKSMTATVLFGAVGAVVAAAAGKGGEIPTRGAIVATDTQLVVFESFGAIVASFRPVSTIDRAAITSVSLKRSKITPTNATLEVQLGEHSLRFDGWRSHIAEVAAALGGDQLAEAS